MKIEDIFIHVSMKNNTEAHTKTRENKIRYHQCFKIKIRRLKFIIFGTGKK